MTKQEVMEALRDIHFLHEVEEEYLEKIAEIGKLVSFDENCTVFREGDPADHVYFVVSGCISLQICSPGTGCRKILTLGPGDILGWSAILEQPRMTATAQTTSPSRMVEIHTGLLLTLCDHNPKFGHEIMRRTAMALAKRLDATRMQFLDLYGGEDFQFDSGANFGEDDAS